MVKRNKILSGVGIGAVGAVGAVMIAGCTVGPNYKQPETPMPPAYGSTTQPTTVATSQPTSQAATAAATQPSPVIDMTQWWRSFNDPTLDRLIEQAWQANLDLKQAEGRIHI